VSNITVRCTLCSDMMLVLLQILSRRCRYCSNAGLLLLQMFCGAAAGFK
jgi:hypothetical protein